MKTVKLGDYIKEYCEKNKKGEDIPVYSVTNTNGFCTEYFSKDVSSKDKSNYKIVLKGFFAYNPSRINVGSVDWLRNEEKVIVSPLYNVFSVSPELDNQYLYYFLKSDMGKTLIKSKAEGSVWDNLKLSILSEFPIPLPSIDEQQKFATKIDKCNEIIKQYRLLLEKYDTLIKSRFIEMFGDPVTNPKGWNKKELQELVTDDCTVSYGIVQTGENQKEGIKVFRPIDIVNRKPVWAELIKTTKEISNKYKKTLLKGRELLITVRANIGDTCVIGSEFKGCNVGRGIVPIRTNERLISLEFLKNQFDTVEMNRYVKSLAKGITLIQLNMEDLRRLNLIVPPLDLQNEYTAFVQQIDKSKFKIWSITFMYDRIKKKEKLKMFEDQEKLEIDLLNRQAFLEMVIKAINYHSMKGDSTSFSIEGDWGVGKTWIIDRLYDVLLDIQNDSTAYDRFCIFKYNAWEYDYYNEPLLSLLLSIKNTLQHTEEVFHIKPEYKNRIRDIFNSISEYFIEPIAIAIATNYTGDAVLGVALGKQFKEIYMNISKSLNESSTGRIKNIRKLNPNFDLDSLMETTITSLRKITEDNSTPRTIIIIVDELDRCLPEYALKVLERMHHISNNVKNIQIIYSIDRKQLTETIKHYYGNELTVNKYLKKFISFSLKLKKGNSMNNITKAYLLMEQPVQGKLILC